MVNVVTQQVGDILIFNLFEEKTHARIRYYLNLKEYELVVTGEITASYKWVSGTKESFIDLMLRCESGYLLMKLGYSRLKIFNLDKSLERTIEDIKDNYSEDIEDSFLDEVKAIEASTSEGFYKDFYNLIDAYDLNYLDISECVHIIEEHPHWLVRSIELFCSDIKPLLEGGER